MPYRLLSEILGAHETTISLAARRIIPLLAAHGITGARGGTRIPPSPSYANTPRQPA